jgi:predicted DCC family thiol-disulfide oxidoreductase YuxK
MEEQKKIILFDGVCNLCNSSVQFVIKRDKNDIFRFAALQSAVGQKLAKERGINTSEVDSIILIEPQIAYYTKSDAALMIAKSLSGGWSLLGIFMGLPKGLRDTVYDWVARNRYQWYGRKESCMIPTEAEKGKFLN